jgi:post-segregation antitoxin (ccd killing protein)
MNPLLFSRSFKRQRTTVTVTLPAELLERIRDAAYWSPGATMAGLITEALEDLLKQRELKNGRPFAPRLGALKPGRRKSNRDANGSVADEVQRAPSQIPA